MLADWFERDPGEVITLAIVLSIALVIGGSYLWYFIRAKRNPIEPRQAKVVRHLLDRGFVICDTGGMVIWPVDLELKETKEMRAVIADPGTDPEQLQADLVECFQTRGLCGIVGKHVVRFSRKGREMFSVDDGPPRVEVWVYLDQLNDHKDFDAKLSLERYCSADADEGAKPFDSGHAGFDAFFPDRVASKRAAKLFQDAGRKLDGVTRFAEKWGEQLDYARISRHIRLGLTAGVVFDAEDPAGVVDDFLEDAVELAGTIEAVLDSSFVAQEHVWVDRPIYARLELLGNCPKCDTGMPLNGPTRKERCRDCFNDKELDEDLWDILTCPLDDFIQGDGSVSTSWANNATQLNWKVTAPTCAACGAELPVDAVEVGTIGVVRCTECEAETSTFPAPEWLQEVAPGIEQIYGAEGGPETADGVALKVDQEAHQPIAMTCPGCGGALMVSSDADRTITCEYCDLDVFLPDALWKELHPAKTTRPWWVRYATPLPAAETE